MTTEKTDPGISDEPTTITKVITFEDGQRAKNPHLVIMGGKHMGKVFRLDGGETIVGRSPECKIWIEDHAISRKHFKIIQQKDQILIQDLGSTNGTFLNGRKVQSAVLNANDKIQISTDTIFHFKLFDEDESQTEQIRYDLGARDAVTGIYNKTFLLQRIGDEFSFGQRQNHPLSVVMIDIDHFKAINDTHGHLAGDQVLQDVCKTVSGMIREEDVFCRYGGEEFVIIMRNTPCQAAVNLSERIRIAIERKPIESFEQIKVHVTVSMGVATNLDRKYRDYVALLADADRFLYQAKGAGRNRVLAVCKPQVT